MMQNNKSQRSRLIKLLALIPIVGVALALNAKTVTHYVYDEPQKQQPIKKGKKAGTIKMGNETIQVIGVTADDRVEPTAGLRIIQTEAGKQPLFIVDGVRMDEKQVKAISPDKIASISVLKDKAAIDVYGQEAKNGVVEITLKDQNVSKNDELLVAVEEMPEFPGGAPKLLEYLSQNIRYPKDAEEAKKQGRVIVSFVVEKDGSISDAKVVKSVDPSLDAEALRVVNTMPNWIPGKQSGKAVNVKYSVPITFRLDGGKPKEVTQVAGSFTPVELDASDPKFKELVSRLPGAKIDENGNITVNGKPIKKILVDGKPVEAPKTYKVRLSYDDAASTMQKVNIVEVRNGLRAISDSGKNPLFILDGKAIDQKNLKDVDPQTIESISLLKDKAAINLYGEKAKDGVVVITSKK